MCLAALIAIAIIVQPTNASTEAVNVVVKLVVLLMLLTVYCMQTLVTVYSAVLYF
jgi:hypothetical protein